MLPDDRHAERTRALDPGNRLVVDRECIGWRRDARAQRRAFATRERDNLAERLAGTHVDLAVEHGRLAPLDRQVDRLAGRGIIRDFEIRLARKVSAKRWPYVERGDRDVAGRLENRMHGDRGWR